MWKIDNNIVFFIRQLSVTISIPAIFGFGSQEKEKTFSLCEEKIKMTTMVKRKIDCLCNVSTYGCCCWLVGCWLLTWNGNYMVDPNFLRTWIRSRRKYLEPIFIDTKYVGGGLLESLARKGWEVITLRALTINLFRKNWGQEKFEINHSIMMCF